MKKEQIAILLGYLVRIYWCVRRTLHDLIKEIKNVPMTKLQVGITNHQVVLTSFRVLR
jgi:hypothetical protein